MKRKLFGALFALLSFTFFALPCAHASSSDVLESLINRKKILETFQLELDLWNDTVNLINGMFDALKNEGVSKRFRQKALTPKQLLMRPFSDVKMLRYWTALDEEDSNIFFWHHSEFGNDLTVKTLFFEVYYLGRYSGDIVEHIKEEEQRLRLEIGSEYFVDVTLKSVASGDIVQYEFAPVQQLSKKLYDIDNQLISLEQMSTLFSLSKAKWNSVAKMLAQSNEFIDVRKTHKGVLTLSIKMIMADGNRIYQDINPSYNAGGILPDIFQETTVYIDGYHGDVTQRAQEINQLYSAELSPYYSVFVKEYSDQIGDQFYVTITKNE